MTKHEYTTPLLIVLLATALSIAVHLLWCGTPMQSPESRWQEILEYHREFYPFSTRFLTTWTVTVLSGGTDLSVKETFFLLQYVLAGLLGLAFYRFLRLLGFGTNWANTGLAILMGSLPIIFAHSEPIFTWDDFWVYLGMVLCFSALLQRRIYLAALCFTLALYGREQTLLYYPAFLTGLALFEGSLKKPRAVLAALVPLALFVPVWLMLWEKPDPVRYQLLAYNFQSWSYSINSIYSLFMSFGFCWAAWIIGVRNTPWTGHAGVRLLVYGSLLTVIPTLILGLGFAYARETRILFPPFVFVYPLALVILQIIWNRFQEIDRSRRRLWITLAASMVPGMVISAAVFRDFDYRNCHDFCRVWGGLQLGLMFAVVWGWWRVKRATASAVRASTSARADG